MDVGPGDRVIALYDVDASRIRVPEMAAQIGAACIRAGAVYTVSAIDAERDEAGRPIGGEFGFVLVESETHWFWVDGRPGAWHPELFRLLRKAPDISEWLETSTDYEEPRRVPATPETVTA